MQTVSTVADLADAIAKFRASRAERPQIAFVPTMGALHEGHLTLVRHARALAPHVVASVFVNPTQFGPGEDFALYPRQPEKDAALLASAGCELLFLPEVNTIYPLGGSTFVEVGEVSAGLEGAARPGHFRGVATVVSALFHLVQPDLAIFGAKDAQQLAVIRRMVRDQHFPLTVVGHPIVREPDGLAMSSRNVYLAADERRAASVLHRALEAARSAISQGERGAAALRGLLRETLAEEPLGVIDYAEVVDADSFQPIARLSGRVVIPIAVRFGHTRLLDNLQVEVS
ncbi:MAG: pantoate--beta-alanine ligase [Acidobacteriota bacterium]